MAENGWEWMEITGNILNLLEMTGSCRKRWTWGEMSENYWKLMELYGNGWK